MGMGAVFLTLLTSALWGGTPVAIRFTVDTLPPVLTAGCRFALAVLFMVIWCRWKNISLKFPKQDRHLVILLGVMLFFQISTFNLGILWSNASHGTLFINSFIFWVMMIEHFQLADHRLNFQKVIGLLVAASGTILILGVERLQWEGDVILLLSAVILGIKIVITKRATRTIPPGQLIFWHDVIGVLLFFLWSFSVEEFSSRDLTSEAVWGLLYQGICVAGFCFAIQAELLKKHAASQIAVYSFTTPLFGMLAASLIRDEKLTHWFLLAGVLVATGIFLVNLRTKRNP